MGEVKQTMQELQRHKDAILRGESEIVSAKKKLQSIQAAQASRTEKIEQIHQEIKQLKMSQHSQENELAHIEEKIEHITHKLSEASNQKEYEAGESEKMKAQDILGTLEEEILQSMELLSEKEEEAAKLEKEDKEEGANEKAETETFSERIERFSKHVKEHTDEFQSLLPSLPQQYRSRFVKLTQSKDGKAIAELNGTACTGCNFSIPAVDLNGIRAGDVVSCTNCGRYVFESL